MSCLTQVSQRLGTVPGDKHSLWATAGHCDIEHQGCRQIPCFGLEGSSRITSFQPRCNGQGQLPADQDLSQPSPARAHSANTPSAETLSPPVFPPLSRCQGFVQPLRSGISAGEGLCHAGSLHEAEVPRAARTVSAPGKAASDAHPGEKILAVLALPEPQCPNPQPSEYRGDGILLLSNPILPSAGRALEALAAGLVPEESSAGLGSGCHTATASGLWAGGTGNRLPAAPPSSCASKREAATAHPLGAWGVLKTDLNSTVER